MKRSFAVFFVFLVFASVSHAQTPVSKETANTYFGNCVAAVSPQQAISQQGQEMLCACTAARLTQFFSMEEMQAMSSPDPATARPVYNKMMVNIYAPCMEEPTREYHYRSCIDNPQITQLGDGEKICRCAADKLAEHMKLRGGDIFAKILARDPTITDPMSAVFNDPEFATLAQSKAMLCLN